MSEQPATQQPAPAPIHRALTTGWGWAQSKFSAHVYRRGDDELGWAEAVEAQSKIDSSVTARVEVATGLIKKATHTTEFRWFAGLVATVTASIAGALVLAPDAFGHPAMWPAMFGPVAIQAAYGFIKARAYDKGVPIAREELVKRMEPQPPAAETPP